MKILTATERTQGEHLGDFHWCHEGELVTPPTFICDRDIDDPTGLGGCGCGRGWHGLDSRKSTTTATVTEFTGLTPGAYREVLEDGMKRQGWIVNDNTSAAMQLCQIAAEFPVGTVLGHRLGELYVRAIPKIELPEMDLSVPM